MLTPGLGEPRELQATDRAARVAIGDFSEEVGELLARPKKGSKQAAENEPCKVFTK